MQISDTHIGKQSARFMESWKPTLEWIRQQNPVFLLHGGDITLDGADEEDDMAHCAELVRALDVPCHVTPGNHDVGVAGGRQPVNLERLARWQRHFGADRWVHDIEEWRLIGFNSMILGSGFAEEDEQFSWIEQQMRDAGGRRIGWFCHQPLFIHGYDDPDNGYWSVPPEPRRRLEALSRRFDVGLVSTGHLHISHATTIGDTHYVWCPSTAFTVAEQPEFPGEKVLGGLVFDFEGASVKFERVQLPSLQHVWIEDVVAEIYPRK